MAGVVRNIEAARRATAYVCDRDGVHKGQGLLLDIDGEGTVVLTCHHVIAPVKRDHLCVKIPRANDLQLGEPIPARYDEERSHPEKDAVVLRVERGELNERPLLHRLEMERYDGSLEVNVRTHLQPDNFDATLRPGTQLDIPAESSGDRPGSSERYSVRVFRLANAGNAKPGISGGVVLCEGGVLGLVHFSRQEDPRYARECYLVPLTVWAEGWPALARLIDPLVDKNLRDVAKVRRACELEIGVGEDVSIAGYRGDLYLEREVDRRARAALERPGGGVVIVGRPKSGKTRLARELLRGRPGALVVIPDRYTDRPPPFEPSGFAGEDVVLFFDDLHLVAQTADPLAWRKRFEEASGRRCLLICTSRDGDEWEQVTDRQRRFLDQIGRDGIVFTSRVGEPGEEEGEDLSKEQKEQLAKDLGLSDQEAEGRFDGTPGSLLLDLDEMQRRYRRLREKRVGDVSMSRLLDAAKLLNEARQPGFHARILRAVAEEILGSGRISPETWRTLRCYTQNHGFGRFEDAGNFQTYRPYLEQCVSYKPPTEEIEQLQPILRRENDSEGLFYLAYHWHMEENDGQALTCLDGALYLAPDLPSAWFLKGNALVGLQRHEEAVEAHERALYLAPDLPLAWFLKGIALDELQRHEEAVEAYERALYLAPDDPEAWFLKGIALGELQRHEEAVKAYERALDLRQNYSEAWFNMGNALFELQRHWEAVKAYKQALDLTPDDPGVWNNMGNALFELQRDEDAVRAYERALDLRQNYPEAWSNKALALADLERYDEVVNCLCRAWHLWEGFPDKRSMVAEALRLLRHDAEECE